MVLWAVNKDHMITLVVGILHVPYKENVISISNILEWMLHNKQIRFLEQN